MRGSLQGFEISRSGAVAMDDKATQNCSACSTEESAKALNYHDFAAALFDLRVQELVTVPTYRESRVGEGRIFLEAGDLVNAFR